MVPLFTFAKDQDLGEIVVQEAAILNEDQSAFVTVIKPDAYQGEYQTTAELLQKTVGVRIINQGGLGQVQTISIRGSSPEQVIVLLDGIRLNSAQRGGVNIASIPLEMIERIEVTRGGTSAVYGSDGIGGVVNIISKRGQKKDHPSGNIKGTYGSFHSAEASASVGHQFDLMDNKIDFFASHTHTSSEGDFPILDINYQEQIRINNQSISESPFIRLGLESGDWGRIEISDQFYWVDRGQPGFGEAQLGFAKGNEWRNFSTISYEKKQFIWDQLDFKTHFAYRIDEFTFQDPLPRIGPAVFSNTKNESFSGEVKWQYFWEPFQLLSFTTELREDQANVFSLSAGANTFQNFSVRRFTYAFILRDELQFFDGALSLLPTLRFEDTTQSAAEWVPKFGVVVKPFKHWSFKGNVSRVFRNPNFDELFFPESEFIGGNPFLVPESGISADVGVSFQNQQFDVELSAFYSEIENAIFFVPISATRIEPVNFLDNTISQGF